MSDILHKLVYKTKTIGWLLGYFVNVIQLRLLSFYKEPQIVELIKSTKKAVNFAFFPYEAFIVYSVAKSQSRFEADMAEVGVYQGGSARIICEAKGERRLHLFDTFGGLPTLSEKDSHFGMKYWQEGEFSDTNESKVKKFLSKYNNVVFHKGRFPETADSVKDSKFSFVHLDVDLYESTKACLEFFYPRLVRGGIILTHDYHSTGVQTAFKEYCGQHSISVLELTGPQCMIIKID